MKNICEKKHCTGCGACLNSCPKSAIEMVMQNGFFYPQVDSCKCVDCNLCENICPANHDMQRNKPKDDIAYALFHKEKQIRDTSSSGGAFYAAAEWILKQGGVVFGAAWTDLLEVRHIAIDRVEDIALLQGSKYLQSDVADSYKEAKKYLEEGRTVLFSGVSCQIAGLLSYLGKPYHNLYTCGILCHGGASPEVFQEHIKYVGKKQKSEVVKVDFRHKTKEKCQNLKYYFKDGTTKLVTESLSDYFYCGFMAGTLIRPACFECKYVGISNCADLVLGDFWGVNKEKLEYPDNLSSPSLVLVYTDKGAEIFEACKENWFVKERPLEEAVCGNMCFTRPIPFGQYKWNKLFFAYYKTNGYEKAAAKYLKLHYTWKDVLKKILGRKISALLTGSISKWKMKKQ